MKPKNRTKFPAARIKKIMQSDEEVGKLAAAVPVLVSKALELFLQSLVEGVADKVRETVPVAATDQKDSTPGSPMTARARARSSFVCLPAHLKKCIETTERFDFLKDLVAEVSAELPAELNVGMSGGVKRTNGLRLLLSIASLATKRSRASTSSAGKRPNNSSTSSINSSVIIDDEGSGSPAKSSNKKQKLHDPSSEPTAHLNPLSISSLLSPSDTVVPSPASYATTAIPVPGVGAGTAVRPISPVQRFPSPRQARPSSPLKQDLTMTAPSPISSMTTAAPTSARPVSPLRTITLQPLASSTHSMDCAADRSTDYLRSLPAAAPPSPVRPLSPLRPLLAFKSDHPQQQQQHASTTAVTPLPVPEEPNSSAAGFPKAVANDEDEDDYDNL